MAWKNDGVNGKGHDWYGKGENETQAIFAFFLIQMNGVNEGRKDVGKMVW
jgi:hypothetical protein